MKQRIELLAPAPIPVPVSVSKPIQRAMSTLILPLAMAVVLSGCGGTGPAPSAAPAVDAYIAAVLAMVATGNDDSEPATADTFATASSAEGEPAALPLVSQ